MRRVIFAAVFVFVRLISLGPIGLSGADELSFAAVLNQSADNSTAVILEAIHYTIAQLQPLVQPHTIGLKELLVDPDPEFALSPFAELYSFTLSQSFIGGIDATRDSLAKYFLSNASIPFVTLEPELENKKLKYEIRTALSADNWAHATIQILNRFNWTDICIAFAYSEENDKIAAVKNHFVEVWTSVGSQTVDVVAAFDSAESALNVADACAQRGRRAIVVIADAASAYVFISQLWRERLYSMETIWVSPSDSSDISIFEAQRPALSTLAKSFRNGGFFTVQLSSSSSDYRDDLMDHLLSSFNEETVEEYENLLIITHDIIRMFVLNVAAQMRAANDTVGNPDDFMNRIRANRLGFEGASGAFSFDANGDRDGFIDILNWKTGNGAQFVKQWSWSNTSGLHNLVAGVPQAAPLAPLAFFDGTDTVPPNQTPPVLNVAIAYAKSIGILNQWEYAAQIAINHAIQDHILPGYAINLVVINTNAEEALAVRGALDALESVRPHAFIGGTLNPETLALQYVLKGAEVPQIGPTASSEALGRRDQNPYFMRPIASEYDEARAIYSLMQTYNWKHVAVITSDDDIGSGGSAALDRVFSVTGVNVMSRMVMALSSTDDQVRTQLEQLKRSNARIIICILGLTGFPQILRIGTEMRLFTADYAWIMGGQARLIDTFSDSVSGLLVPGVLLIGRYEGGGPIFNRLRADMTALPSTTYPYSASVAGLTTGVGYVYDACMTIIQAVADQRAGGVPITNGTALYRSMNAVNFEGATGTISYENGERVYSSVMVLFRNGEKDWINFGVVQRANRSLDSYAIQTSRDPVFIGGGSVPPQDVFLVYISYTSPEGLIMCIIAALLMLCAAGSIAIVIRFRENALLRASSPVFLVMILVGIMISLVTVFIYAGLPNDAKCHLQMWLFVMGFVISYGSIVVKNFRLWRLWDMSSLKIVRITNLHLLAYSQIFVIPFLLFLILYSAADPPRARLAGDALTCQTSSFTWYIVILGCVGAMLFVGCFISFKVRTLPQLFNETKYIAVSTYNLTVCLALGVSLFSVLSNISATAAYLSFSLALIFGYGGMWVIIFLPKFWIIFVTPERLKELESGTSGVTRGTGSAGSPKTTVTLSGHNSATKSYSSGRSHGSSGRSAVASQDGL